MITERYLERDGERLLLRLLVEDAAALDVLTDAATLRRAKAALEHAPARGLTEHRLGSFGPFEITLRTMDDYRVALAVDGPDLGSAFCGNQCVVLYVGRDEMLEALTVDAPGASGLASR